MPPASRWPWPAATNIFEQAGDRVAALAPGQLQDGDAVGVHLRIGAAFQQKTHRVCVAAGHRLIQGRQSLVASVFEVGAGLQQKGRHRRMSGARRHVQGGMALVIGDVDRRAVRHQNVRDFGVAVPGLPGGLPQGRLAPLIASVDVRSRRQQTPHDRRVVFLGGQVQRRKAALRVVDVDLGATAQQRAGRRQPAALGGFRERCAAGGVAHVDVAALVEDPFDGAHVAAGRGVMQTTPAIAVAVAQMQRPLRQTGRIGLRRGEHGAEHGGGHQGQDQQYAHIGPYFSGRGRRDTLFRFSGGKHVADLR